jgi:2-haloacid dehalogenase
MNLKLIRLITFDCYGTLIDWETGMLASLRSLLRKRVDIEDDKLLELYGEIEAQLESGPYMVYRAVLGRAAEEIGRRLGASIPAADAQHFAQSLRLWKPFPDTVEALRALSRHYKLAIISNVDDDLFADTQRLLGTSFEFVVTAQQVRSYKPSPKNFEEAIKRADGRGIARKEMLHAAQSLYHDVATANALGLKSAWVNRRFDKSGPGATVPAEAKPSFTVNSMAELARKLIPEGPENSSI